MKALRLVCRLGVACLYDPRRGSTEIAVGETHGEDRAVNLTGPEWAERILAFNPFGVGPPLRDRNRGLAPTATIVQPLRGWLPDSQSADRNGSGLRTKNPRTTLTGPIEIYETNETIFYFFTKCRVEMLLAASLAGGAISGERLRDALRRVERQIRVH